MSGHSKWSTIKHKKAATDKKRGQLFSKLSRAIMVAAKEGGADPESNNALANAVAKARSYSMPRENIDRAIQRGSQGVDGSFDAVTYEGYGPGGAAFVIEALTDNRNRTAANVRAIFNKAGGSMGAPGSVAWMFDRKGVIEIAADGVDGDELMLAAADAGADDVADEEGTFIVSCEPTGLGAVRDALDAAGYALRSVELTMIPKTPTAVDDETARKLLRLMDNLEDDDDVQDVYVGFEVPDSVLADA